MSNLRYRAWAFTIQLPDDVDILELEEPLANVEFMIWQYEEVSHRHIQGYVYFGNARAFRSVKKLLTDWSGLIPHLEAAKGSPSQNEEYCSKEESRIPGTTVHKFGSPGAIAARVLNMLTDIVNRLT